VACADAAPFAYCHFFYSPVIWPKSMQHIRKIKNLVFLFERKRKAYFRIMLTLVIIVDSLYGLSGCTPKFVINVDGYPSPKEFDTTWTSDRSFSVMWFFSRWYKKKIESREFFEYIDFPQHLLSESLNMLPIDTRYVVINIRIHNFKRKRYRLVKCFSINSQYVEEPIGDWTIREYQQLSAAGPVIPEKKISLSVKLLSGESDSLNETIISTSQLHYFIGTIHPSNSGGMERR